MARKNKATATVVAPIVTALVPVNAPVTSDQDDSKANANAGYSGVVKGFIITRETGPAAVGDKLIVKAAERFADALNKNEYATAVKALKALENGPATWYVGFESVAGTDKNGNAVTRTRRATTGLNNAIMKLAFAGLIEPRQFMAVTIPTRTELGSKIVSGTRLFKLF